MPPTRRIVLDRNTIKDAQVTADVAVAIRSIDTAMKSLLAGGLTDRALHVLIRDALPRGSKLTLAEISDVLNALSGLRARYLKTR